MVQHFLVQLADMYIYDPNQGRSRLQGIVKRPWITSYLPSLHLDHDGALFHLSARLYHLPAAIEGSLAGIGDNREWSTIKEILATHQRSTIVLAEGKDQIHHTRVASTLARRRDHLVQTTRIPGQGSHPHMLLRCDIL
jgi:hypothetical protein